MDYQELIEKTFTKEFNQENYEEFLTELFNQPIYEESDISYEINKGFEEYIDTAYDYGNYTDTDYEELKLYVIKLKKSSSLERARTMQRNFIAKLLTSEYINNALVAFYDESKDWRFSFVKIEYELDEKGKVIEKLTPAKRHSYLVGPNQSNHTCQKQCLDLINKTSLLVSDVEETFNIENVTDEFYKEYKRLYLNLNESLEDIIKKDEIVKKEFEAKDIKTSDFSKKLMGQLVFLYFLQKKGWLGVDKEGKWGEGSKNFLRDLYERKYIDYENFFNDVLEPLFYQGFCEDVTDYHYNQFNCKIPFLNGGLFEQINNYDWENTDITLENSIFEEIFNTFDRFNFTVKEDEPLEKEVAVDPEMLGKVFEKLLDSVTRKDKGAFYTPRDIVHYMCKKALISYLDTNTEDIPIDAIETFINEDHYLSNKILIENESIENSLPPTIVYNAELLDDLLKKVKIADPAVGSGAFPVGMMIEIVKARQILLSVLGYEINTYELKRETIENSLYGVDISYSATNITKLRFWLSLVVDEENIDDIKPLPNLDNHIMCGNSLIDEFEDIRLFDYGLLETVQNPQLTLYPKKSEMKFRTLEKTKKEFFNEKSPNAKQKLKDKINQLKWEFTDETIKESVKTEIYKDKINSLKEYNDKEAKPFFIWELEFSEIFRKQNPGFDIIIGNPPYVSTKGIKNDKNILKKLYKINDDLYNYFFLKGYSLLKNNGTLSYITSNTYLTINSKINLRKLFQENKILEIVKVENVFENAMVDPAIITFKKEDTKKSNYSFLFKDAVDNFDKPEEYLSEINLFRQSPFNVFFKPNEVNMQSNKLYNKKINNLIDTYYDKIKTSKLIEKNSAELQEYRNNLKSGSLTLLGLVTEGGQGLATANNGKFVGVLEGTKNAERIIKSRPVKLFNAIEANDIKEYGFIKSKEDAIIYLSDKTEHEIRNLFDTLKEQYDRDIFGRGYMYKIISEDEIADLNNLSEDEKTNGISSSEPHYVLYDKGDKDGNKWYLKTPFYINWSKENVKFLKDNAGKKGKGGTRYQNSQFYFRNGFCWTDVNTIYIKSRLKENGVYDVLSMSLFSLSPKIPDWYIVCLLNSKYISEYIDNFINSTQHFQINDARIVPIKIPTEKELKEFNEIFSRATELKKQEFKNEKNKGEIYEELDKLQDKLDSKVYSLYEITK